MKITQENMRKFLYNENRNVSEQLADPSSVRAQIISASFVDNFGAANPDTELAWHRMKKLHDIMSQGNLKLNDWFLTSYGVIEDPFCHKSIRDLLRHASRQQALVNPNLKFCTLPGRFLTIGPKLCDLTQISYLEQGFHEYDTKIGHCEESLTFGKVKRLAQKIENQENENNEGKNKNSGSPDQRTHRTAKPRPNDKSQPNQKSQPKNSHVIGNTPIKDKVVDLNFSKNLGYLYCSKFDLMCLKFANNLSESFRGRRLGPTLTEGTIRYYVQDYGLKKNQFLSYVMQVSSSDKLNVISPLLVNIKHDFSELIKHHPNLDCGDQVPAEFKKSFIKHAELILRCQNLGIGRRTIPYNIDRSRKIQVIGFADGGSYSNGGIS